MAWRKVFEGFSLEWCEWQVPPLPLWPTGPWEHFDPAALKHSIQGLTNAGASQAAQEGTKKLNYLENILSLSGNEDKADLLDAFEFDEQENFQLVHYIAAQDDRAYRVFCDKAFQFSYYLSLMPFRRPNELPTALLRAAIFTTYMLNQWVKDHPKEARELAAGTKLWPMLKSPIPRLSSSERKLFTALNLKREGPIARDLYWVHLPQSKTGVYALGLYNHISLLRDSMRFLRSNATTQFNAWKRRAVELAGRDILDLPSIKRRLLDDGDPVSGYLRDRLSGRTRQFLASRNGNAAECKTALARDLNIICQDESMTAVFFRAATSQDAIGLRKVSTKWLDRPAFNRFLLSDAFPREFEKNRIFNFALACWAADLNDLTREDSLHVANWLSVARALLVRSYPSKSAPRYLDEKNPILASLVPRKPNTTLAKWQDKLFQLFEQDFEAIAGTLEPVTRGRKKQSKTHDA